MMYGGRSTARLLVQHGKAGVGRANMHACKAGRLSPPAAELRRCTIRQLDHFGENQTDGHAGGKGRQITHTAGGEKSKIENENC